MASKCLRVLCIALCLAAAGAPLAAQSQATTGVIQGTVTDANGGGLPGAAVAIRNTATNFEQSLTTDRDGRFRAPAASAGSLPGHGQPAGLPNARPGRLESRGRCDDQPAPASRAFVGHSRGQGHGRRRLSSRRPGPRASTRIDEKCGRGASEQRPQLPRLHEAHARRHAPCRGPDGDELSINGQKGIQNNISVDGADFNNPFFGEQRGGQRPAFTFNLDAVKEIVVVADGANAEFGRSSSGLRQRRHEVGHERHARTAGTSITRTTSLGAAKNADGSRPAEVRLPTSTRRARRSAARSRRTPSSSSAAPTTRRRGTTKQTDPNRIEPAVVAALAALGSPDENLPIERTNDARVFLGKVDWQALVEHPGHRPLQLHLGGAEQRHVRRRLLGTERQRRRDRPLERGHASAVLTTHHSEASPTSSAASTPARTAPAATRGRTSRAEPAAARHGVRLRRRLPLRRAVLHPGRLPRHPHPVERQRLVLHRGSTRSRRASSTTATKRSRPSAASPTAVYIFSSTSGFLNYLKNPNYVECSNGVDLGGGRLPGGIDVTGPVILYLQFTRRRRSHGGSGRNADDPADRAGRLPAGHLAAHVRTSRCRPACGGKRRSSPIRSRRPSQVFFAPLHRQDLEGTGVPLGRNDSVGQEDVAAAPRHRLGSARRRQDGHPGQRGHLLRPHPGPRPGLAAGRRTAASASRSTATARSATSAARFRPRIRT